MLQEESRKAVFIKVVFAIGIKGVGAASAFFVTFTAAGLLTPKEAGPFLFALTMTILLSAVARSGLDLTILRTTGQRSRSTVLSSDQASWLLSELSASFVVSVFISLLVWVVLDRYTVGGLAGENFSFVPLMSISLIFMTFSYNVSMYFQGQGQALKSIVIGSVIGNLIFSSTALVVNGFNQWAFETSDLVVLYIFSHAVASLVALFLLVNSFLVNGISFSFRLIRISRGFQSVKGAKWLWILGVSQQVIHWSGQLISGFFLPPEDLAVLAVSQRIAMLISFSLLASSLIFAPRFALLYQNRKHAELQALVYNNNMSVLIISIPLFSLLIVFSGSLLSFFSPEYSGFRSVLIVLCFGQLINALTGSVGYLLMMSGNEKYLLRSVVIVAPLGLALSLVLIPLFGLLGAALAVSVPISCQNILAYVYVRRVLELRALCSWV